MKSTSILSTLASLSVICLQLTSASPIDRRALNQPRVDEQAAVMKRDPASGLENTPGPYKFQPAPAPASPPSLENTPGPHKFRPAPARRDAEPGLETTPGPYKFAPAAPASLESTPGPYHFQPAPLT